MENDSSNKIEVSALNPNLQSRGALVVLEGLDRSGKSSQCIQLLSHLQSIGCSAELWRFPDRNTAIHDGGKVENPSSSECDAPEIGLLAPDMVLYLDISPELYFHLNRHDRNFAFSFTDKNLWGKEVVMVMKDTSVLIFKGRSEKNTRLFMMPHGWMVDACLPMEKVQKKLREYVLECVAACKNGRALSHFWSQ
ncbi:thymidylate kinase-like [Chenopodium quinoa]|uniref:thymidylate kinase-like n=1 Tax=Chenopodium quinoa TaxID=63459 RepID=UPI000B77E172|nr:thymidylate kinase-like [Chenopodium quinoa]